MMNNVVVLKELERFTIECIKEDCFSADREANGCNLDQLMAGFLISAGFKDLEKVISTIYCWRA